MNPANKIKSFLQEEFIVDELEDFDSPVWQNFMRSLLIRTHSKMPPEDRTLLISEIEKGDEEKIIDLMFKYLEKKDFSEIGLRIGLTIGKAVEDVYKNNINKQSHPNN